MPSLAEEMKRLRKAAGFKTQKALSDATGVSQPFISQLESGERDSFSEDVLHSLAAALGVPVKHLADLLPPDRTARRLSARVVPVLGLVEAGGGVEEQAEGGETINVPEELEGAEVAYKVKGLSMIDAAILDGDYLFVRRNPDPDAGEIVVAWIRDRGQVVKKYSHRGEKRLLQSQDGKKDPRYPHEMGEGDYVFGVLIGQYRRYRDLKTGKKSAIKKKGK